jgi:hypothetical protein
VYCNQEGIKHILFRNFKHALPVVQSVVESRKTTQEILEQGTAP